MFQGVCRDIQCDRTQYLSFDGNCELNPEPHKNQDCYMIFYKNTPLDFRLLKLNVKSLMEQPMNATDIEMYAKESDTDKRYVEYFIIKLLVEYLNYVKDVLSLFQSRLVRMYGFDMLIELVSYDESLFNGQYRIEVPNKDSGGKDVLVKLKTDFPKDTESCVNKDMVYVDHLLACPFVQLKFEEVHMNFINGSLIFLDTYNMSLPPLKYRIENENILICLSDYVVVYDKLPEMARNKELATLIFTEISAKHLISLQCICVLLTLF